MASLATTSQSAYEADGFALLREVAPAGVAKALLGVIHRDMTSRPETLSRMLACPTVNEKPAYEFYSYKHPTVMGFHWALTARVREAVGRRLTPTYAYFRVYQKGDILKVHSDRPSCEHSLSLLLAYSDDQVWNFDIGSQHYDYDAASALRATSDFGDEPFSSLALSPGDAVLYRGVNRRHGRTQPNPNQWSAHLFLHWVDTDGPFGEWAFDKRVIPEAGDFRFPSTPAVA